MAHDPHVIREGRVAEYGSKRYFLDEVCQFMNLLGQRSFWQTPGRKEAAVKAIGHLFLETEDRDEVALAFRVAIQECARREALLAFYPTQKETANA